MFAAKSRTISFDRIRGSTQGARLFRARQFAAAAAVTALLPIASALFISEANAQAASGNCADELGLAMIASPLTPWKGAPLRVVFTSEKQLNGELSLVAPDGAVAAKSADSRGGPP